MIDRLRQWFRRGTFPFLLELALLLVLGVALAHWTWVVFAPRAVAESTLDDTTGAGQTARAVRRNLFGNAKSAPGLPAADASSSSKIRLLGVLSRGPAGSGRAIFAQETGKPKTVEAGAAVAHGYVLKEVHSDHVVISRDGAIERLTLERRSAAKN